jgi:hypothetical protein
MAVNAIDEGISTPQAVVDSTGARLPPEETEQVKKIAEDSIWPPWTIGSVEYA